MAGKVVGLHTRKKIRDAVVELLTTVDEEDVYPTDAEDRVFANRVTPAFIDELPAIGVYTLTEQVERINASPIIYMRKPSVVIEILVESNSNIDDSLDYISAQVEQVMLSAGFLKNSEGVELLDGFIELGTTEQAMADNGERQMGSSRTTYVLPYQTETPFDTDLENLDVVEADHVLADDQFTIEQGE
jgi:hypothetical protein